MDISDQTQPTGCLCLADLRPAPCAREVTERSVAEAHAAPTPIPRLGLFWALPISEETWDIVAVSCRFAEVPQIGGFRTLELGHVDLWPRIRRETGREFIGEYEDYPRGRVNWREEDQRFLLLLDPTLCRPSWVARVMARFALPLASTLVMTDAHYRSTHKPPTGARPVAKGKR